MPQILDNQLVLLFFFQHGLDESFRISFCAFSSAVGSTVDPFLNILVEASFFGGLTATIRRRKDSGVDDFSHGFQVSLSAYVLSVLNPLQGDRQQIYVDKSVHYLQYY